MQKHWRGLRYVPPATIPPRNVETGVIRNMILSGSPVAEIAAFAKITPRRVYQIARTLGPENPYQHRKVTEKVTEKAIEIAMK